MTPSLKLYLVTVLVFFVVETLLNIVRCFATDKFSWSHIADVLSTTAFAALAVCFLVQS